MSLQLALYCHLNARAPTSTKLCERKVNKNSYISTGTSVHDSPTITVTKTRQVNKLLYCSCTSYSVFIVHFRMSKRIQFLLFLLLRKKGKPVIYNDDIHCTYIQ